MAATMAENHARQYFALAANHEPRKDYTTNLPHHRLTGAPPASGRLTFGPTVEAVFHRVNA